MFPSLSTVTPGDFSNTSKAVFPTAVTEDATFTMVRSTFCSISGLRVVTVTASNDFTEGLSSITGNITDKLFWFISNTLEKACV